MSTGDKIFFAIAVIVFIWNFIITGKYIASCQIIEDQYKEIHKLKGIIKEWSTTHSKCTNTVCMDSVLDDIINYEEK